MSSLSCSKNIIDQFAKTCMQFLFQSDAATNSHKCKIVHKSFDVEKKMQQKIDVENKLQLLFASICVIW